MKTVIYSNSLCCFKDTLLLSCCTIFPWWKGYNDLIKKTSLKTLHADSQYNFGQTFLCYKKERRKDLRKVLFKLLRGKACLRVEFAMLKVEQSGRGAVCYSVALGKRPAFSERAQGAGETLRVSNKPCSSSVLHIHTDTNKWCSCKLSHQCRGNHMLSMATTREPFWPWQQCDSVSFCGTGSHAESLDQGGSAFLQKQPACS